MRYILGYFALITGLSGLELIWAGSAYGFVFVVIAAVLIYVLVRMERTRRRERRYGSYGEAIEGYEKRFTDAEQSLESKLPENVLDSPALVELLSAYEHDADEAEAIRREYAQLQQRFKDWRDEFDQLHALNESGAVGLPKQFAERYDELDRQLSQLLADVKRLDARAAEVDRATDDPLDQIAQGALKLEQAKATCAHVFGNKVPDELSSQLTVGSETLAQARGAIAAGAERPLDAVRLAQKVGLLADAVIARSKELAKLPGELGATHADATKRSAQLAAEISAAEATLETAAETCAPSCLSDVRAYAAEAEQSVEHARSLAAGDATGLALANESLMRAAELVKRIEDHLAALDQAALQGRHQVEQAERAVDRAWASVTASSRPRDEVERADRVVARARELAAEARSEIEQTRPDWFHAASLAKRAVELADALVGPPELRSASD
jgi:hypothetical protein